MYVPAIADLITDAELTGAPTRIYLLLLAELDPTEPRPVKAWAIAARLAMKPQTVGRALALLVERGYLVLCDHAKTGVRTYRIVYARSFGGLTPERHHSRAS